jgi:hypothetical protein
MCTHRLLLDEFACGRHFVLRIESSVCVKFPNALFAGPNRVVDRQGKFNLQFKEACIAAPARFSLQTPVAAPGRV